MHAKTLFAPLAAVAALAIYLAPHSESQADVHSYKIDAVHSAVVFKINHLGVSNTWGRFNKMSGDLKFADGGKGAEISIAVEAGSVDTNSAGRDKHLKNPDFFSAGEFSSISFKSKSWTKTGDNSYDVKGDMTLHGKTNEITIKVTKVGQGDRGQRFGYRIGFDGEVTIKRSTFGMTKMLQFVGDDVKLFISIEAQRQ